MAASIIVGVIRALAARERRCRGQGPGLRILVDEDSQARAQLNILRGDGHGVVAVGELGRNGTTDPEVFDLAQSLERALLTHNTEDFHEGYRGRSSHRGIMALYRDADPRKNLNDAQIAVAIRRLETPGVTIAGDFHVLNCRR
jgi:predicted nuclease of predicted toxin-antitoxin system